MMKITTLATSLTMLAMLSGAAHAGSTISDQRYWPDEIHRASQPVVEHPTEAFAGMAPLQAPAPAVHRYDGGPKSED
ncbi:hypothetical protein [Bradyrhizobium prioriisuperbiae]|uniref:hypothetical protein n=1 Tax=Bradyrhizobium prioriisuperbiae TaxID=2854389 RepID=UPI0028E84A9A|nr:hypothetical protein [Bradyrhizobium prioritasuperba]